MISKKSDSVLAIQSVLKRTHLGRTINESAIPSVESWAKSEAVGYGKSECKNCGLILKSNYFVQGCVNCGSTDIDQL